MESLYQVYPPPTIYEPPSLPLSSLEPGGKLIYYTLLLLLIIASIGGKYIALTGRLVDLFRVSIRGI
jgi:hypothetical protein